MSYVDGFVAAVPKANKQQYLQHAKVAAVVFREHGASRVVECWEDDVPEGEVTSFPKAVLKQDDESIVFSWVEWPSKAIRDVGMQKVFEDERMTSGHNPMPFDGKRLIYGGFNLIQEA
ncbi:DUF1428 domain-containing protein [Alteromonas oceanisediminis]|uniref:DUF1428 domain-containing protein n=1 Tax=Alteromonas oceanisediminis TaxID=2836180 RepID=UPI001BDB10F8|nr:DUF1428 domain-containing protein [Alteromonas oceanisediminis]MBT0585188.1 DUF1428 family protein [Alteromonas oceanisediminis]